MKHMKRAFIILSLLLLGILQAFPQGSSHLETFKQGVLPQFSEYFSSVEQTENGQLKLTASINYVNLSSLDRKNVLNRLILFWQESLIIIHFDTKNELWGWNGISQQAMLFDTWNLNPVKVVNQTDSRSSATALHPWFFYIGGMTYFDSSKNIDLALNAHVGFFLLVNRWDLALSVSESLNGTTTSEDLNGQLSLGLMSKVYFPLKEYNLSPNIGAEIAVTKSSNSALSLSPALLLGTSWYVGIGSLDVEFRIGQKFTAMIGYTFVPSLSSKKKK
jgi:hypothetical protein